MKNKDQLKSIRKLNILNSIFEDAIEDLMIAEDRELDSYPFDPVYGYDYIVHSNEWFAKNNCDIIFDYNLKHNLFKVNHSINSLKFDDLRVYIRESFNQVNIDNLPMVDILHEIDIDSLSNYFDLVICYKQEHWSDRNVPHIRLFLCHKGFNIDSMYSSFELLDLEKIKNNFDIPSYVLSFTDKIIYHFIKRNVFITNKLGISIEEFVYNYDDYFCLSAMVEI